MHPKEGHEVVGEEGRERHIPERPRQQANHGRAGEEGRRRVKEERRDEEERSFDGGATLRTGATPCRARRAYVFCGSCEPVGSVGVSRGWYLGSGTRWGRGGEFERGRDPGARGMCMLLSLVSFKAVDLRVSPTVHVLSSFRAFRLSSIPFVPSLAQREGESKRGKKRPPKATRENNERNMH